VSRRRRWGSPHEFGAASQEAENSTVLRLNGRSEIDAGSLFARRNDDGGGTAAGMITGQPLDLPSNG
jgi:hypothetical protein